MNYHENLCSQRAWRLWRWCRRWWGWSAGCWTSLSSPAKKNLIKVPIIISKILFQIQYNPGIMHKTCYVHLVVRINLKNRTWPERTATERRLPMSPTTPTLGIRTPCLACIIVNVEIGKQKNHETRDITRLTCPESIKLQKPLLASIYKGLKLKLIGGSIIIYLPIYIFYI